MNTTTFDTMLDPTPTPVASEIAAKALEYWGYIVAFVAGLAALFTFYRKYCRGKYKALIVWKTAFVELPATLLRIENELHFSVGESVKQRIDAMGGDILSLGQILSNEIANRRSALQFATTPLFEFNINGELVWANDALLEMTECELPEVEGKNWFNMIAGAQRDGVMSGWERAVKDGTHYRTRFKLVTEAIDCWVVFNVACNKDHKGNVLGWLGKLRRIDNPKELPHLPE